MHKGTSKVLGTGQKYFAFRGGSTGQNNNNISVKSSTGFWNRFGNNNQRPKEITKVVTDIDDTVVSSGGVKLFGIPLGGIDNQFQRGQFYPGVIQFAMQLSLNKYKPSSSHFIPAKISVLTARAREFKFALEIKESGKLKRAYRQAGQVNGLSDWGIGDVYYGSVIEWIFQHRKGLRKFMNFELMIQRDNLLHSREGGVTGTRIGSGNLGSKRIESVAKCNYILIGDTGEKDEEAGERVALKYPNQIKAIFLHKVYDSKSIQSNQGISALPPERKVNGVPIFYFRTYIGAAIKAYEYNLIDKQGLKMVASQAIEDLKNMKVSKTKQIISKLRRALPLGVSTTPSSTTPFLTGWEDLENDIKLSPILSPFQTQINLYKQALHNDH